MTQKIISLGCSITHQIGWANYVSACLNIPLVNLAVSSGSNQLQQKKIQSYLFENNITSEDIVIWQLTGSNRFYEREQLNQASLRSAQLKYSKSQYVPYVTDSINYFDKHRRIEFLSHAVRSSSFNDGTTREADLLEDLLFYVISISKMTPNMLILFGWETIFPEGYLQMFKEKLSQFNIPYIDECIVDWCKKENLEFNGEDKTHPTSESHCLYAKNIILPRLSEMLNIKEINFKKIYRL